MRTSHIYQPLMIKTLLQGGGRAIIREIAAAFLAEDESQLEYYEAIVRSMPGPMLRRHDIVERDRDAYRLTPEFGDVSPEEAADLVRLCDEAIAAYKANRGRAIWSTARVGWVRCLGRTGTRP
jgi:ATP adenylyltransferase